MLQLDLDPFNHSANGSDSISSAHETKVHVEWMNRIFQTGFEKGHDNPQIRVNRFYDRLAVVSLIGASVSSYFLYIPGFIFCVTVIVLCKIRERVKAHLLSYHLYESNKTIIKNHKKLLRLFVKSLRYVDNMPMEAINKFKQKLKEEGYFKLTPGFEKFWSGYRMGVFEMAFKDSDILRGLCQESDRINKNLIQFNSELRQLIKIKPPRLNRSEYDQLFRCVKKVVRYNDQHFALMFEGLSDLDLR